MAQIIGELTRTPSSNRITGRIGGRNVVVLLAKRRPNGDEVWQVLVTDVAEPAHGRREPAAGSVDRH